MQLLKPSLLGATLVSLFAFSFTASADTPTTVKSKDVLKKEYKAAIATCKKSSAQDKKVCEVEAKQTYETGLAEAKAAHEAAKAHHELKKSTHKAAYSAEKAKCDTLTGDAHDKCVEDAKARHGK